MKKIALFPGSFDPFTLAHLSIVKRALSIFDKIEIAIGVNNSKKGMFSIEEREEMIRRTVEDFGENVGVSKFEGLTVNYAEERGAQYILRSMRSPQDFEFERAIAQNNLDLNPDLETVFLISEGKYSHISSTIVREILVNNGEVSHLVPKEVLEFIQNKKA